MAAHTWTGWEHEADLGNDNDRFGVHFLTIYRNGEEVAIIIHRTNSPDEPTGPEAKRKEVMAQDIVDALNRGD